MLNSLQIENFILIKKQNIEFDTALNVLTGDTGSGKSVIINSIRFAIGMRANSDLYFDKEQSIKVTANFSLTEQLKVKLDEHQIDYDDEVEVMRTLSPSGKNKVRINGELVSLSILNDIFENLITIYSQYSVAKFKNDSNYIAIVDGLISDKSNIEEFDKLYTEYRQIKNTLNQLKKRALLKDEKQELLEMRMKDLSKLDDSVQLDKLIDEKKLLDSQANNAEINAIASEQISVASNALNQLMQTIELDDHLKLLNDALINVDEVSFEIAKLNEPVDQNYLNQITEYISMCRRLARKYNVEIDNLVEFKNQIETEYADLDAVDVDIQNFENKLATKYELCIESAKLISKQRQTIANRLVEDVNFKLKQLSLNESDFKIVIEDCELNSTGIDSCNFMIRMNAGSNYSLIHKSASGGEIARFLLALEAVINSEQSESFIIFDEIDTGVSGHVATEMAQMMREISSNHKLLIVTHLAQVAAISQNHFVISKQTMDDITESSAKLLGSDEKPIALAKMISGKEISEDAIEHAKVLLAAMEG